MHLQPLAVTGQTTLVNALAVPSNTIQLIRCISEGLLIVLAEMTILINLNC